MAGGPEDFLQAKANRLPEMIEKSLGALTIPSFSAHQKHIILFLECPPPFLATQLTPPLSARLEVEQQIRLEMDLYRSFASGI